MDAEAVLDVVLSCLLGTMRLSVYAICLIWRARKYQRGLHYSGVAFAALFADAFLGIFLPIGGFTFLDGGKAGTKSLIVATLFCPIPLVLSIRAACFCVFIDGNAVVERTLFSETRIDLTSPGAFIDAREPFEITYWISIGYGDGDCIQINSRRIEGDLTSFLESCKKIQDRNRTETLPGDL